MLFANSIPRQIAFAGFAIFLTFGLIPSSSRWPEVIGTAIGSLADFVSLILGAIIGQVSKTPSLIAAACVVFAVISTLLIDIEGVLTTDRTREIAVCRAFTMILAAAASNAFQAARRRKAAE